MDRLSQLGHFLFYCPFKGVFLALRASNGCGCPCLFMRGVRLWEVKNVEFH